MSASASALWNPAACPDASAGEDEHAWTTPVGVVTSRDGLGYPEARRMSGGAGSDEDCGRWDAAHDLFAEDVIETALVAVRARYVEAEEGRVQGECQGERQGCKAGDVQTASSTGEAAVRGALTIIEEAPLSRPASATCARFALRGDSL